MNPTDPAVPLTPGDGPTPGNGHEQASPSAVKLARLADPEPVRPTEPDSADCCGEGCIRCVYDRYDEALERYQRALAAWRERQR